MTLLQYKIIASVKYLGGGGGALHSIQYKEIWGPFKELVIKLMDIIGGCSLVGGACHSFLES